MTRTLKPEMGGVPQRRVEGFACNLVMSVTDCGCAIELAITALLRSLSLHSYFSGWRTRTKTWIRIAAELCWHAQRSLDAANSNVRRGSFISPRDPGAALSPHHCRVQIQADNSCLKAVAYLLPLPHFSSSLAFHHHHRVCIITTQFAASNPSPQ
jgi:hypothetical protein